MVCDEEMKSKLYRLDPRIFVKKCARLYEWSEVSFDQKKKNAHFWWKANSIGRTERGIGQTKAFEKMETLFYLATKGCSVTVGWTKHLNHCLWMALWPVTKEALVELRLDQAPKTLFIEILCFSTKGLWSMVSWTEALGSKQQCYFKSLSENEKAQWNVQINIWVFPMRSKLRWGMVLETIDL